MQEFQIGDDVRIRATGEIGTIVHINLTRPSPYLVRIEDRKRRVIKCEPFRSDEIDLYDQITPPPPRFSASGWKPSRSILDETRALVCDDDDIAATLSALKADMAEIKAAIERRPTGWQLFWIGTIALFALSAAMEIAGGWS